MVVDTRRVYRISYEKIWKRPGTRDKIGVEFKELRVKISGRVGPERSAS